MFSRFAVTLLTSMLLVMAPGAAYAFGLGSAFSDAELEIELLTQSRDRVVIEVRGTGYAGKQPGIDIALNPSGYLGSGTKSTFVKSVRINPQDPAKWTYRFTLDADEIAGLKESRRYQIMTMRGGGRDVIDSADTRTENVAFDFEALARPEAAPAPGDPGEETGGEPSSGDDSGGASGGTSGGSSGSSGTGGADGGSADEGTGATGRDGASGDEQESWTAPETPPTAKGLRLGDAEVRAVDRDEILHASAAGFRPDETGIKVVVYSSPIVLATDIRANGQGVARWSGRLPDDIGPGEHTLTFQGSVDRGIRFVVTGTPNDGECAENACAGIAGGDPPAIARRGGESGTAWLTWVIVAVMIGLAAVAGTIALLSGHRRSRAEEWDEDDLGNGHEPGYERGPVRYPDGAAYGRPERAGGPPRRPPTTPTGPPAPSGPAGPPAPRRRPPEHRGRPVEPDERPEPGAHRPRPPESFAPPEQRAGEYAPWR